MSWNGIAGIEMEAFNNGNSWLKHVTLHLTPLPHRSPHHTYPTKLQLASGVQNNLLLQNMQQTMSVSLFHIIF